MTDIKPGDRITVTAVVESAGHDDQHVIVRIGGVPVQVPVPGGSEIPRLPLIHDLAIVLRGVLHPDAQVGPPTRLASRRLKDVLGIEDGEMAKGVEARLRAAFDAAEEG
jgi:hypothetical protein